MHILLFLYSNEYTGGLMTSVITVRIYVYGSSIVLFSSSRRYSQTRRGTLWSMQWDFCPLLIITLPIQSEHSAVFPLQPSADESCISWMWWIPQPCTLDPLKGNEQRPGTPQGPWQPGSSMGSWKQSSAPHVIWLWHITDLFLTHELRWQQKSGEGMNNSGRFFNLAFTVNNLFQRQKLETTWNFI